MILSQHPFYKFLHMYPLLKIIFVPAIQLFEYRAQTLVMVEFLFFQHTALIYFRWTHVLTKSECVKPLLFLLITRFWKNIYIHGPCTNSLIFCYLLIAVLSGLFPYKTVPYYLVETTKASRNQPKLQHSYIYKYQEFEKIK